MKKSLKERISKEQWKNMVRAMISEYRKSVPDDPRSDLELARSLMEHFSESGLVKADHNGKYIIPTITFNA